MFADADDTPAPSRARLCYLSPNAPDRAMALGLHSPAEPTANVAFYIDWSGSEPDAIYVVLNGERHDLDLVFGTASRGMRGVEVPAPGGCGEYYFVAETGNQSETWPEVGSYGFGNCAFDDDDAQWIDGQLPLPSEEEPRRPNRGPDDQTGSQRPHKLQGTMPERMVACQLHATLNAEP